MLYVIGQAEVRRILGFAECIAVVGGAMAELSAGRTQQMLRRITPIAEDDVLSAMAGVMAPDIGFGAKVISVYPGNGRIGRQSHQGVVVLFERDGGEPLCVLHAGEITRIRTAAASALATRVLARPDARHLAVLGYGEQAQAHVAAIAQVRDLASVRIWGRAPEIAAAVACELSERHGLTVTAAPSVCEAVRGAEIICTTTAAREPLLFGEWLEPGQHLNIVGSSEGSSAEVDGIAVARSRVFADHREGVLGQGGEVLRALAAGQIGEDHVLGEIGDVLTGGLVGRTDRDCVTMYKSLGHIVQDLAAARFIYDRTHEAPDAARVPF